MRVNWTVIFIPILSTVAIVGTLSILFITVHSFHSWMVRQIYSLSKVVKRVRYEIDLHRRVSRVIKRTYGSHSVEMIFEAFSHFYETNFKDIEHWALPKDQFQSGINDLMFLYKWIKKTRPQNYSELEELSNYDFEHEKLLYWGARYRGFKFRIDPEGELKVSPLEAVDAVNPEPLYERNMIRLQNELYELDSTKAKWIIDRRRFLGI